MAILAAIVGVPTFTAAENPVSVQITCPIGGQVFEVIETDSCTTYPVRLMSFAPTSSCDFITRLPQCPGNFLPMYKDFSEADLALLRDYMVTESYDSSVDLSRFYLAYIIEKYIGNDPSLAFSILMDGYWFDPLNTFADEIYAQAFFYEALGATRRAQANDRPFVQAMIAYVYLKSGQLEQAQEFLNLSKVAGISDGLLPSYIARIEACMAVPDSADCAPDAPIYQQ
ncbi:MAG: hypothetical protein JKY31_04130 [Rhodobacteraceae bacterium]|nr:hypothetical protein [Paracoccaceae bacterium]